MTDFVGTAGNDSLTGTNDFDYIDIRSGGRDTVNAGDGDDRVWAGASLDAKDRLNGGDGFDVLVLSGPYAGPMALTDKNARGFEQIGLAAGQSYQLVLTYADRGTALFDPFDLHVEASGLGAGDQLSIDASGSTADLEVSSGEGSDSIKGGSGDDRLHAGAGADTLLGGAGNDQMTCVGGGRLSIDGGSGDDIATVLGDLIGGDRFEGGTGYDVVDIQGALTDPSLSGFTGVEEIRFDASWGTVQNYDIVLSDDVATPDLKGKTLVIRSASLPGTFSFDGSAETDARLDLSGGGAGDSLVGGALADTLHSGRGIDTLLGGGGDDVFLFSDSGLDPGDRIDGGTGVDTLWIAVSGRALNPVLFEDLTIRNIEKMHINGGRDIVLADGNIASGEVLVIEAHGISANTIDASAVIGGRLDYRGEEYDPSHNLLGASDSVIGGGGRDRLSGATWTDTLSGGGGNDIIFGGSNNDTLDGGTGLDRLVGGQNADLLTGGAGSDTFAFQVITDVTPGTTKWDMITDLQQKDVIDLSGIDADNGVAGNQAFIHVGAFTHEAGQATLTYDMAADRTMLLLDTNGDGVADGRIDMFGQHETFENFVW